MDDETPVPAAPEESPLAEEAEAVQSRGDWRSSVEGSLLITVLAGAWLIISAFLIPYEKPAAPVIWGVVIIVLAGLRLIGDVRSTTLALATVAAGALTVLTAFVLGDSPGPTANMAVAGLMVVILQVFSVGALEGRSRTSRG